MKNDKVIVTITLKPKFINSFLASFYSTILFNYKIGCALSLFLISIYLYQVFYIFNNDYKVDLAWYLLYPLVVLIVFIILVLAIIVFKIIIKSKLVFTEITVDFYKSYLITKGKGYESKIDYNQIKDFKTFDDYMFIKFTFGNSYLFTSNNKLREQIITLLKQKVF